MFHSLISAYVDSSPYFNGMYSARVIDEVEKNIIKLAWSFFKSAENLFHEKVLFVEVRQKIYVDEKGWGLIDHICAHLFRITITPTALSEEGRDHTLLGQLASICPHKFPPSYATLTKNYTLPFINHPSFRRPTPGQNQYNSMLWQKAKEGVLTDQVIESDGVRFNIHKALLRIHAPLLENREIPLLYNALDIEMVLEYFYTGLLRPSVTSSLGALSKLYLIAHELKAELLCQTLSTHIDFHLYIGGYLLSDMEGLFKTALVTSHEVWWTYVLEQTLLHPHLQKPLLAILTNHMGHPLSPIAYVHLASLRLDPECKGHLEDFSKQIIFQIQKERSGELAARIGRNLDRLCLTLLQECRQQAKMKQGEKIQVILKPIIMPKTAFPLLVSHMRQHLQIEISKPSYYKVAETAHDCLLDEMEWLCTAPKVGIMLTMSWEESNKHIARFATLKCDTTPLEPVLLHAAREKKGTDMEFRSSDGISFPAHSFVVSLQSKSLLEALQSTPIISLNAEFPATKLFHEFLYTGHISEDIPVSLLLAFRRLALQYNLLL